MARQPLIWASICALKCVLRALSHKQAVALGGALGSLVRIASQKKYKEAVARCEKILGVPRSRAEEIVRGSYRHFGKAAAEFIRLPLVAQHIDDFVRIDGEENLASALAAGHGAVVVTAHIGNWEYAASCVAQHGYPTNLLGADQRDDRITELILELRRAGGCKALGKATDLRAMIKALMNGEGIAVPVDQDAKTRGVVSDFLGFPASTPVGIAKLAEKLDCAIVPGFCVRNDDGFTYTLTLLPAMRGRDGKKFGEDVQTSIDDVNDIISDVIRAHPDQWMWMYPRWESVERGWFDDVLRNRPGKI